MAHYRDDHTAQTEEELKHLEDEHEKLRDNPEKGEGAGLDLRDLPKPIYRIKATHSNETFFAYFIVPEGGIEPAPAAEASATLSEDLPEATFSVPPIAAEGAEAEAPIGEASPDEGAFHAEEGLSVADPLIAGIPVFAQADEAERPAELAEAEAGETGDAPSSVDSAAPDVAIPLPIEGAAVATVPGGVGSGAYVIPSRTMVVAPTRYGRDLCELQGIVLAPGSIGHDDIVRIERIATAEDLHKYEANAERESKAFESCKQKIAARNLPMKLVSAHYLLEEPKVLFYFSAETRVDFRELVKDLVAVFKMRIELRQIGVRDEARVTGGCGVCGRVLCCHGVTDKLVPVSIKMAKDQNLSLNSMKISGPCGRLLCCLAYEYGFYRDARRELPNEGARFPYDGTLFRVVEVNVLAGSVKMAGEDGRMLDMPASRFAYAEGRWQVRPEE